MKADSGYPKNAPGISLRWNLNTHESAPPFSFLARLLNFLETSGFFFVSVVFRRFLQELSVCHRDGLFLRHVSPPARASLSSHLDAEHVMVLVLVVLRFSVGLETSSIMRISLTEIQVNFTGTWTQLSSSFAFDVLHQFTVLVTRAGLQLPLNFQFQRPVGLIRRSGVA